MQLSAFSFLFLMQLLWFGTSANALVSEVERIILKGGQHVLLAPDSSSKEISIQVWFRAGSLEESTDKQGLSHLIQHLFLAAATKEKKREEEKILKEKGIIFDGKASRSYTGLWITAPADQAEFAWEFLEKKRTEFQFDDAIFAEQLESVIKERRDKVLGSLKGELGDIIPRVVYADSSLGNSVFGEINSLNSMKLTDCEDFVKRNYTSANTVFVVLGKFDSQLIDKIRASTGRDGKTPKGPRESPPAPFKKNSQVVKHWEHPRPEQAVSFIYPAPSFGDKDWPGLQVLAHLLGGRLFLPGNLAKAEPFMFFYRLLPRGVLSASLFSSKNLTIEELSTQLQAEIDFIIAGKFTQGDVNRAVAAYVRDAEGQPGNLSVKGHNLGSAEALGGFEYIKVDSKQLAKLTIGSMKALAKKYLGGPKIQLIVDSKPL